MLASLRSRLTQPRVDPLNTPPSSSYSNAITQWLEQPAHSPTTRWLAAAGASVVALGIGRYAYQTWRRRHYGVPCEGSVVVVTGASSGIGAEVARLCAQRGAETIVLVARTAPALEALAAELNEDRGEQIAYCVPADLGDAKAASIAMDRILHDFGAPQMVLHCAGAGRWLRVDETPQGEVVSMMAAPYFAAFNSSVTLLPAMLRSPKSSAMMMLDSPSGVFTVPGAAGYASCRAALAHLTRCMRMDLRGSSVQISHVTVGETETPYFSTNAGSRDRIPWIARVLFGPVLSAETAAKACVDAVENGVREIYYPRLLSFYIHAYVWPFSTVFDFLAYQTSSSHL